MDKAPGSFRDPSGYVYVKNGTIFRTITEKYQNQWPSIEPFLQELVSEGLVPDFEETSPLEGCWKTYIITKIPFISYPYEWSFSQLKAAALLTLRLQRRALAQGLTLKDASAYNVQFIGSKPIFIDHLSFETFEPGQPWAAYKQFCSHFLAPLALESMTGLECGKMLKVWIDGIPLELAASMLPLRARFRFGLLLHLFAHAKSQIKYADAGRHADKAKQVKISLNSLNNIIDSLERTVLALQLPKIKTEWGDYYTDTNYSDLANQNKYEKVKEFAHTATNTQLAVDFGANTGRFSEILADKFDYVISADIDPLAVERHFLLLQKKQATNTLPFVLDVSNPSPSLGFDCTERQSFSQRINADCIVALALIHHITITAGIPMRLQADFFYKLLSDDGVLILEFVPKSDSQVQRLLAYRKDIFPDYNLDGFINAFNRFRVLKIEPISNSERTLLLLKKM